MLPQLERFVTERARHVINPVPRVEPAVQHRDLRLALPHEGTIQVNDLFVHRVSPFCKNMFASRRLYVSIFH